MDAFLYGFAHTFDVGAHLVDNRGRFSEGFGGDLRALRSDWECGVHAAHDISNGTEER